MRADDEAGPRPLAWSLRQLARRVARVDLVGYAAVEAAWPRIEAAVASAARPRRLAGHELTVSVPSGAHAARARRDAGAMLAQLAELVDDAPTSLRVTVAAS